MKNLCVYLRYPFPLILLLLCIFCAIPSCNTKKKATSYTIGFSQCTFGDSWRKTMQREIDRELSFHPGIRLIVRDANLSAEKQVEQIKELIDRQVDLLIVSPSEAEPVSPVVKAAYARGIPVILVDRSTLSKNYTAFIGASNYRVGSDAGTYANSLLKGKGNVVEIGGQDVGSSADIGRHQGFTDFIRKHPDMKYISRFSANWDHAPAESEKKLTAWLSSLKGIDLIFAQNDRLALGAANACRKLASRGRLTSSEWMACRVRMAGSIWWKEA